MNTTQKIALFCLMTAFVVSWVLLAAKPLPNPEDLPLPPAPEISGTPLPTFEEVATRNMIIEPLSEIEKEGVPLAGKLKEDIEELSLIARMLDRKPCSTAERAKLPDVVSKVAVKLTDPSLLGTHPKKIEPITETIARFYVHRALKSGALDPAAVPQVFAAFLERPPESFRRDHEELLKACQ